MFLVILLRASVGHAEGNDCDDNDWDVHVGAEEISDDGIDQDCDGIGAEHGGATCDSQRGAATSSLSLIFF